ncbi:MAG TPA: M18 family aminopeptidase [Chlamydiales bacterium]|jgi:aspartyl aminopeptidase
MDFFRFLQKAPTAWHAAKEISNALTEKEFIPLFEGDKWKLERGKSYFVEREGALLAAFRIPKKMLQSSLILASHTDSPALKIKPQPDLLTKEISQLGTEIYGGPLLHSWFDRDLALAGRLETDRGSQLVFLDDMPLVIPQLAIHLDKTIHEKGLHIHKQDHLKAILSIKGSSTLEQVLKKKLGIHQLYAFDLFLVPTEKPSHLGLHGELLAGYRIDNLSSAYACLEALLKTAPRQDTLQMALFWDHEEIGSLSATGAASSFVDELLERITLGLKLEKEELYCLKSRSLVLSADVAHGWNPNFSEKYDPQNSPLLGSGTVLKFNAGRKYASDAPAAATLLKIAEKQGLTIQKAANRSDIPSGSTVGPIMSANTGIPTLDIGLACWAMHSTREIIAASDLKELEKLLQAMLNEWTPQNA